MSVSCDVIVAMGTSAPETYHRKLWRDALKCNITSVRSYSKSFWQKMTKKHKQKTKMDEETKGDDEIIVQVRLFSSTLVNLRLKRWFRNSCSVQTLLWRLPNPELTLI